MYATNTWPVPCNERYDQPQQAPSTTESSPISPQQFVDWFGSSPIEPPYASQPYLEPMGARSYLGAEEAEPKAGKEQEENRREKRERESTEAQSEPASPRKRRRGTGEDGEKKMVRSSRACTVCRQSKSKCMPGPSQREPDEDSPCMRCSMTGQECTFTASLRGKYPIKKFARLQKQLEHMERMHRLLDKALRAQTQSRHYAYHLI